MRHVSDFMNAPMRGSYQNTNRSREITGQHACAWLGATA